MIQEYWIISHNIYNHHYNNLAYVQFHITAPLQTPFCFFNTKEHSGLVWMALSSIDHMYTICDYAWTRLMESVSAKVWEHHGSYDVFPSIMGPIMHIMSKKQPY